jgi:predicted AAA+ superfamily ATPase
MLRQRIHDLDSWAGNALRKPLVIRGARQVGKSWLVRSWGTERFGRVVEVNLERRPETASCFADNDPKEILQRLEVQLGQRIPVDGSALLFLDEIQAVPEVLAKLRWFAEEIPKMPVITAGSLLDFTLAEHRFSMPVGRISYLHLEPMGFVEFCHACGEGMLARWLDENLTVTAIRSGVPAELHAKAAAIFRSWVLVGGMPAAVEAFARERSYLPVADVHRELLATVRDDFTKYADRVHHRRLAAVLHSVPNQLGQKFTYSKVDRDERAAALKQALDLLVLARVCHRVVSTRGKGLPLGAGADTKTVKVIHLDVGLASSALRLDLTTLERADDLDLVNEGAIAEQAVGQLLRLIGHGNEEPALWYWSREARSSSAEVDYLAAPTSHVLPIEVKSGAGGAMRSLHIFMAEQKLSWATRFNSAAPLIRDIETMATTGTTSRYRLLSLPAYAVEFLPRLAQEMDAECQES